MSQGPFVIRDGELVPKRFAAPLHPRGPRSSLPRPMVISDHMDAVQSQGNGRWYESKSALRAHYRQDGFEEMGNDSSLFREYESPPEIETTDAERQQDAALWDQFVGT